MNHLTFAIIIAYIISYHRPILRSARRSTAIYINFLPMKQIKEKKHSAPKAYRLKPQEYLSNTFYKRGKTFFSSQTPDPPIDPFRKTDAFALTKNIKDFIRKASPSPVHLDHDPIKRRKGSGSKGKAYRIQRSPYISNTTEIQKMLRLLVPVKGPNQSLKLQIKRHNELNFRNAQLLIVKRSQNFQDRMKAFSNRMGLPEDTKIYMMNSRDLHIKAALNRRGWIESTEKSSVLFHLKWVYKDDINDYQTLQQGQFYNHFRNNQELTNKNYLRKNIKKANLLQRPRFPISFDIELNDDNQSFQQTFARFESFRLLNNIAKYLSNQHASLYSKMQKNPLYFKNLNTTCKNKSKQVRQDILYTLPQAQIRQDRAIFESYANTFEFFCLIADEISKQLSVHNSIFQSKRDNRQASKIVKKLQEQLLLATEYIFKHFSTFYIVEIWKMWHHAKKIVNNYGLQNMWIIKPTGVSRGSGITITNDSNKISQLRFGKIVQKYIEHPLLLDCQRKFDIRQWVLVTSFQPLKAYAFKCCYARFSSTKYSNDKYENMQKHLTNYSQNKDTYLRQKLQLKDTLSKYPSNIVSAMSEEGLASKIGQNWTSIKEKFYSDILKTLNCCKYDIIQKQGCFEVFGFDIIIGQDYQPYILEVNLSPACEQRQFLHQYLDEMADGLINMIEGGEPLGWIQLLEKRQTSPPIKSVEQQVKRIQRWWRKSKREVSPNKRIVISEL